MRRATHIFNSMSCHCFRSFRINTQTTAQRSLKRARPTDTYFIILKCCICIQCKVHYIKTPVGVQHASHRSARRPLRASLTRSVKVKPPICTTTHTRAQAPNRDVLCVSLGSAIVVPGHLCLFACLSLCACGVAFVCECFCAGVLKTRHIHTHKNYNTSERR